MSSPHELMRKLQREQFYPFAAQVFDTLHPGQRFQPAWHVQAMCHALQRVVHGDNRRLLITIPPRHMKSICTAVALVAWVLGHDPGKRIMVASYGSDLAEKHARDCRTILESAWYQRLFPGTRLRRTALEDLQTTAGGGRFAVSLGGPATGFGADLLIVDDLMKAADAASPNERQRVQDYYEQTLYSRVNDKRSGAIIAIQQRLHEDDLAGYLINKGGFEQLNLPAIAECDETVALSLGRQHHRRIGDALFPEREPRAVLEEIRREVGPATFSAQYQQNPVPPGGNRLRWEWFQTYDEAPPRDELLTVVQSWDTACGSDPSADFSACTTWGLGKDGVWLLLDAQRRRLDYPDLRRWVRALQRTWQADVVLIEKAATGGALVADLRREEPRSPSATYFPWTPRLDKQSRFDAQTGKIEAGRVRIPHTAPWLEEFRRELLAFPKGRFDDQVDSATQFLDCLDTGFARDRVERALNGGRRVRPKGVPRHLRP